MSIRAEIEREVRRLENCECQVPPSVGDLARVGNLLLRMSDSLLTTEWELYGKLPALVFVAAYATGSTPRELGIKSIV